VQQPNLRRSWQLSLKHFSFQGIPRVPCACTGLEGKWELRGNSRGIAEQIVKTAAAGVTLRKCVWTNKFVRSYRQIPDKVLPTDKETGKQNFKDLHTTSQAKLFQNTNSPTTSGGKQLGIKYS